MGLKSKVRHRCGRVKELGSMSGKMVGLTHCDIWPTPSRFLRKQRSNRARPRVSPAFKDLLKAKMVLLFKLRNSREKYHYTIFASATKYYITILCACDLNLKSKNFID